MLDWNWFFSTLAQSAAAIVGLIGAFVATKILNNYNDFYAKTADLDRSLVDSRNLLQRSSQRDFDYFNKSIRKACLVEIDEYFQKAKQPPTDPEYYLNRYAFSPYDDHNTIKIEIAKQLQQSKQSFNPFRDTSIVPIPAQNEGHLIDQLYADVKKQISLNETLIHQLAQVRYSSNLVTQVLASLLLLFLLGIIYPISFLPISGSPELTFDLSSVRIELLSLKGFLLFSVTVIFFYMVYVFNKINSSLKFDESKIRDLRSFCSVDIYSQHFTVYELNTK